MGQFGYLAPSLEIPAHQFSIMPIDGHNNNTPFFISAITHLLRRSTLNAIVHY